MMRRAGHLRIVARTVFANITLDDVDIPAR
jgi:hypothetical protein